MLLHTLTVINFRNFTNQIFSFDPKLTIIRAPNARGKTNILESIYFITSGTGFRESREQELINTAVAGAKQAFVEASFVNGATSAPHSRIALILHGSVLTKTYFINKTKKHQRQYLTDQTRAVLFAPQQLEMLTGSPDGRRQYLNMVIGQIDLQYKKHLDEYEKALRRRNKILEQLNYMEQGPKELAYWNESLITHGSYLTQARMSYIDNLNKNNTIEDITFHVDYVANEVSSVRQDEVYPLEFRTRKTMIGPQKDDIVIYMRKGGKGSPSEASAKEGKEVHHFASRSEQRFTLLWLKLQELHAYEKATNKKPMLLLDDIFSEFDEANKERILRLIGEYQTVLTTTEEHIEKQVEGAKKLILI